MARRRWRGMSGNGPTACGRRTKNPVWFGAALGAPTVAALPARIAASSTRSPASATSGFVAPGHNVTLHRLSLEHDRPSGRPRPSRRTRRTNPAPESRTSRHRYLARRRHHRSLPLAGRSEQPRNARLAGSADPIHADVPQPHSRARQGEAASRTTQPHRFLRLPHRTPWAQLLQPPPGVRDKVKQRLEQLSRIDSYGFPTERHGRNFFSRRLANENRGSICIRTGLDGKDEVLVNPADIGKDETTTVFLAGVTRDGKLLTYGIRHGGEDEEEYRILN